MTTTFAVSDVDVCAEDAPHTPLAGALSMRLAGPSSVRPVRGVLSARANAPALMRGTHPHGFIAAVHASFAEHRPLTLSPDDVWLCIAQGFAQHVALHAAALRPRLVDHAGAVELVVDRDPPPQREEEWGEVVTALAAKVREHVGRRHDLLVADFSTTGEVERVASEMTLLSTFQHYFSFMFHTICGIPSITLRGTTEDWRGIRRRVSALSEFDLSWWTAPLDLVLSHFEAASEGRVDQAFWQDFYNYRSMSGGSTFTGWIHAFFPYRRDGAQNLTEPAPVAVVAGPDGRPRIEPRGRLTLASLPDGSVDAPVTWDCLGTKRGLRFHSGFAGCCVEDGAVRPVIGWWIDEGPATERLLVTRDFESKVEGALAAFSWSSCGESLVGIGDELDVRLVRRLTLSQEALLSLDGIEAFTALESLVLGDCLTLRDVSALQQCASLREVTSYFSGDGARYDWTKPDAFDALSASLRAAVPHPEPMREPRLHRGRWWVMRSSTPLERREDGLHFGRVEIGRDHTSCSWWLVLRGPGIPPIADLPSVAKIGSWSEIVDILGSTHPGVALWAASPSIAEVWFGDQPDVAALRLVTTGPHWDAIVAEGTLAFYAPTPDPQFECHLVAVARGRG